MQTSISGINALQFQNTRFDIVDRNGQPWLRLLQIGGALRYSKADLVGRIYQKHADEFTDSMTAVIKMPTAGGVQDTRIFSLRGAHLLAMLSRTEVAKDFRRWVLDILERESVVPPAPTFAKTITQATRLFQSTQKAHTGLSLRQSYLLGVSAAQEAFGVDLMAVWKLDPATLPDVSPQAALARLPNKNGKLPKPEAQSQREATPEDAILSRLLEVIGKANKYRDVKFTKALKAGKMPDGKLQGLMKRPLLQVKPVLERAIADRLIAVESGRSYGVACSVYVLVGGAA